MSLTFCEWNKQAVVKAGSKQLHNLWTEYISSKNGLHQPYTGEGESGIPQSYAAVIQEKRIFIQTATWLKRKTISGQQQRINSIETCVPHPL